MLSDTCDFSAAPQYKEPSVGAASVWTGGGSMSVNELLQLLPLMGRQQETSGARG